MSGVGIRAAIPTWTISGNATIARTFGLSFLLPDGQVLVVGGLSGTANDLLTDLYNPATGTWSPGPQALFAHPDVPAGVRLADGRILITGGRYGYDVRRSAEIFNPATNTWTAINQMNAGRAGHTLTLLQDGRILAAGGWNGGFLDSAEVYDPGTGVWTSVPAMGQAKWFHSATLLNDGRVLIAGGERYSPDTHFRETQYFNPGTATWTNGPLLNTGRTDHEAARLPDGRVMVIGGLSGFAVNGPVASTEIFDGVSWQFGPPMSAPRLHFPLVVMADGSLLVTGGTDTVGTPQTALAGAERYDPSTNTWSNSGVMNSPRRFHSATQLLNGRVLVVGGATAAGSLITSEIMGDAIAPETTASRSIAPNGNGWNNGDVTITLTAADNPGGIGVQSIVYSLSGAQAGGATSPGATASVTVSSENTTTVTYHATDLDGNVEADRTLVVRIDKTLPVLAAQANITLPATAGGTVVDFSPSASDVPSGIASISSSPLSSGMRFPAGTTTIQVTALDAAGNAAVTSFNVTVVPSAPVITVTGGDFTADGNPHPATAVARDTAGTAVAGTFNIVYGPGGASAPTAVGRYSASASFTSGDAGILSATPWTTMAADPHPKTTPSVAAINGKLYVYGFDQGATQSTFVPRLSIYDPATNTWSLGTSPNLIRAFASVGVINGKLYVAGGCVVSDCRVGITNALEIYDPASNSWSFGAGMIDGRFGAGAGVVNGRFIVTGGTRACPPCSISNTTEVYDPVANAWTSVAPIAVSRELPSSAVINGLLYVISGFARNPADSLSGALTGRTDVYDLAANTWSTRAAMPTPRSGAAAAVVNGTIYVVGGSNGAGPVTTSESYDPISNSWFTESPMPTARFYVSAGVLNSKLYIIDGFNGPGPLATNERFDPSLTAHVTITAPANVPPTASFTASPNPAACQQPVSFDGSLSSAGRPDRQIVSYAWDFGDGTPLVTGGASSVNHGFSGFGSYTVTLTVQDNSAPSQSANTSVVVGVSLGNRPPVANHGGPYSGDLGSPLQLDGAASSDPNSACGDSIVSYDWTIDGTMLLNGVNPVLTAAQIGALGLGPHNVSLTVTDEFGLSSTATTALSIYINVPTASFTANPNPVSCNQVVSFNAFGSSAGRPDRQIVNYAWDFGDGSPILSGGASSLNHGYGAYGSYTASLTVTDNNVPAKSASTSLIIVVSQGNQPPFANHGGPYSADLGSPLQLNGAASSDPNSACGDSIVSYDWTIDGAMLLSGVNPILTAAQIGALGVGPHNVFLKVTDEFGLSSTATTALSIYSNVPTASFTANPNPVSCNQVVSFNAFGSTAGRPDRQIVNYAWDFGDGSPILSGGASSLNHSYGAYGSYTAALTVIDNNVPAKSASTSLIIVVSQGNQPPQANPGGPYSVNSGSSVQLNGAGSSDPNASCGDSIVSYSWTIDGTIHLSGPTPTLDTAAHNLASGNHSVSLTVTDEFGAPGTSSTTLNVQAVLVSVSVSPSRTSLSIGQNQTFQAIGNYSDGTTRMLPSSGNGGGGGGGVGFTIVPHWSVQFVSSQINLSACATPQSPAPISFSSQAINDRNGVIHETWSPGTPVVTVDGAIDATTVNLTLVCTTSPVQGTITAQWTGTKYEGTFSFNGSAGTVAITGWSQHAPMPEARFSLAAAASEGLVYAIGGIGPNAWSVAVDAYNPATNTWATVGQMATPRTGAGAVTLNGKIYVVGGHVAGGIASGIIEAYNPSSNTWDTALTPMPTPRAHLAVVTDGAYIYAIGGDTAANNGGGVSTVERYDPSTNNWLQLASMPSAGGFIVAGVLDGAIVVAGSGGNAGPSSATDIYEIGSNTWRAGPPMPAARTLAAAGVANGGLYVVGGTVDGLPAHDAWVFYPSTNFRPEYWGTAGPMQTGRLQLAAAVVNNVIYALGGMVAGSNPTVPLATNETLSTPPLNTFAPGGGFGGNGGGNTSLPTVEWQSTNSFVAGVDGSGSAHGNALGQTTIVAVLSNGMSCVASDTCATLTVVDLQPPFLSLPGNQSRQATGPSGAANVTWNASANDNVDGNRPVTCGPASGSTFPFGPTTVNCSASDLSGNTASGSFVITVIDTNAPFMNVPSGDQFRQADRPAGGMVTFTATANDTVDGVRTVTCNPPSGSIFPFGPTEVTCTASDTRNNVATRKFTVIVQDTQAPFLNVPNQPVRQAATSPAGAVVDFGQFVSAFDSVDGNVTPLCSPASRSVFPIGSTGVTCQATDAHNNASPLRGFTVTVEDRPTVLVPANIVAEATSAAGAAVLFTATASSFRDGPLPVQCLIITGFIDGHPEFGAAVASGSVFPLGVTTVGCLATNATATEGALFTITVVDTLSPALRLVSPLVDDFVATAPASVVVDVEVVEAVGVTGVKINGVNAAAAGSTPAGTLWRATVPGPAVGAVLTLVSSATDAAGHTGSMTAVVDNDGIAGVIDRSRATGADQSAVYSSEFNDGTTAGSISRLNNAKVTAVQSGASIRVGLASAGITHVSACSGNVKYVVLDEQGEGADLSCTNTGTVTVTAHATGNGKIELYKSTPEAVALAQLRCFFLPLAFRHSAQCSPSPSPVSYYYSYQVKLKDGDSASTGSPVTASPDNTRPIEVTLLQIDDEGNEVPVADFTLDPGESADVNITPGSNRADQIVFSVLNGTVTFIVGSDEQAVSAGGQATMTVDLTPPPPVSTTSGDVSVEATSASGAVATFTATAVDAAGNPVSVTCSPASGSTFPIGDTTVTCSATDAYGSTGTATLTVHVRDTMAPAITAVVPSQTTLAPPNHKMMPINIRVTATDVIDAAPVCTIASVTSSELINGLGDGDTGPDWHVTGPLSVDLRAERAGNGPGRVYAITVQCADASGNIATAVARVTVAHDSGK